MKKKLLHHPNNNVFKLVKDLNSMYYKRMSNIYLLLYRPTEKGLILLLVAGRTS